MAVTTTALPQGRALVSLGASGPTWTDVSGATISVEHSGGDQLVGMTHTLGGDFKVVVPSGKIDEITTTVSAIWTVTSNETWDYVNDLWVVAGAKSVFFKFSPQGGASADLEWIASDDAGTAVAVAIQSFGYPSLTAAGDIITWEFSLVVPQYVQATIA